MTMMHAFDHTFEVLAADAGGCKQLLLSKRFWSAFRQQHTHQQPIAFGLKSPLKQKGIVSDLTLRGLAN